MSDSIDRVFVKAISTIRALSTRSGYGSLPRPPIENRIRLYGLYKQATEGNVEGIMQRPTGTTSEDESARKKFDAWKSEEGLTKTEAKRRYISFLIDTMKTYASGTHEARELLNELEFLWDQIKDIVPSPSPPMTPVLQLGSIYGDSFLDDRSAIMQRSMYAGQGSEYLSRDVAVLKKEVGIALKRITSELTQINQRNKDHDDVNRNKDDGVKILGIDVKVLKKIGLVLFKFLGGVVKRFVVDVVILICLIKFIKFKNGLDINMQDNSGVGSQMVSNYSYFNKALILMFKVLNKVSLVIFNRLYIEID